MAGLNGRRLALPDEIRGFCIQCMVVYHGLYLLGVYADLAICTKLYAFFQPLQLLFASAFIFISGFCTQLSRSVAKRGMMLLGIALGVSFATLVLLPRVGLAAFADRFGILHLLSLCMLLYALCCRWLRHVPVPIGVGVCIALYGLTCMFPQGIFGLPFASVALPDALLHTRFLFPLGLHDSTFYSADYFPLLPHGFVFFAGSFVGRAVCERDLPASAFRTHIRFYAFSGRHSLAIYLLHVPILYGAAILIRRLAG